MILNSNQIQKIIPHRYLMLFVDQIEKLVEGQRAVGINGEVVCVAELMFAIGGEGER